MFGNNSSRARRRDGWITRGQTCPCRNNMHQNEQSNREETDNRITKDQQLKHAFPGRVLPRGGIKLPVEMSTLRATCVIANNDGVRQQRSYDLTGHKGTKHGQTLEMFTTPKRAPPTTGPDVDQPQTIGNAWS